MLIKVDMRGPTAKHDGSYITRWEDEEDRKHDSRVKPKAKKRRKETEEVEPRTTDENDKPRMKTSLWLALRDRDNPKRRQLQ